MRGFMQNTVMRHADYPYPSAANKKIKLYFNIYLYFLRATSQLQTSLIFTIIPKISELTKTTNTRTKKHISSPFIRKPDNSSWRFAATAELYLLDGLGCIATISIVFNSVVFTRCGENGRESVSQSHYTSICVNNPCSCAGADIDDSMTIFCLPLTFLLPAYQ